MIAKRAAINPSIHRTLRDEAAQAGEFKRSASRNSFAHHCALRLDDKTTLTLDVMHVAR